MSYSPTITAGTSLVKTNTVLLPAQVADVASVNFSANTPGMYRVAYYIVDSVADLTAGAVKLNIAYTDNGIAQTLSSATVALTTIGLFTQGEFIVQLASGSIAYSTTHTGILGTAKYDLFITLERLN